MYDVIPITSEKGVDCGPTCLAMLLQYYGEPVDLEQLISECNTGLIGCTAKDLMRVGKAHGLDMITYKMDVAELVNQDRPAIVWWKYSHFVVFCGQDGDGQVVICNPSSGRYRMSKALFGAFYSGVSLWNGEPHDLLQE